MIELLHPQSLSTVVFQRTFPLALHSPPLVPERKPLTQCGALTTAQLGLGLPGKIPEEDRIPPTDEGSVLLSSQRAVFWGKNRE